MGAGHRIQSVGDHISVICRHKHFLFRVGPHPTPGVTCEACHGPGRAHVEAMRDRGAGDRRVAILNPAKLEPADVVDFWARTTRRSGQACGREGPRRASLAAVSVAVEQVLERWRPPPDVHRLPRPAPAARPRRRGLRRALSELHAVRGAAPDAAPPCKVAAGGCVTSHMPKYEVPEMHHEFTDHLIRVVRSR